MVYKPLISIITLTYNHEKYITECIESVLCQTYENWEMIIIDDASTDRTPEIVDEYASKDRRIKFIKHKENYGPYYLDKTYNEALNISRGEWIAILEGDDVWAPYKLERQVSVLTDTYKDNIVVFHGRTGSIYEDLNLVTVSNLRVSLKKSIPKDKPYDPTEFLLLGYNPIYALTALVKKEALEKIGGFIQKPREIMLVDYPTWLRLGTIGKFYYDSGVLGFWRRHSHSITMNNSEVIAVNYQKAVELFINEYESVVDLKIKDKECVGILPHFAAIYSAILKEDWKTANFFWEKLNYCIKNRIIDVNMYSKLGLFISFISIFLKNKRIFKLIYSLKRKHIDKKICDYYPFFFRDEKLISILKKL